MRRRGLPLAGQQVLITGGGSGLGRRMALLAADRGAWVAVWDLDLAAAESTCTQITTRGGAARAAGVDVSDEQAVQAAAEQAGPVDVLVNNAGIVSGGALLENSSAQVRRTFEVNVLALYWTTRALLPGMLDRDRGTVVNLASAAGLAGVARQTDYSASKHAVVGFTESLRAELRTAGVTGVRTLLVCPYYVDTGMFTGVRTKFPRLLPILSEEKVARAILDAVEAGRQQYIAPLLARLVPIGRVLPVRAFDAMMDFFGINQTMDHFVGQAGRQPTEPDVRR